MCLDVSVVYIVRIFYISIMFSVSDPQTDVYWRLDYRRIFRTELDDFIMLHTINKGRTKKLYGIHHNVRRVFGK